MITLTATCNDCSKTQSVDVHESKFEAYRRGGTAKMHFPDGDWTPQHRDIIMHNASWQATPPYLCGAC
jgi:hypothetical protein